MFERFTKVIIQSKTSNYTWLFAMNKTSLKSEIYDRRLFLLITTERGCKSDAIRAYSDMPDDVDSDERLRVYEALGRALQSVIKGKLKDLKLLGVIVLGEEKVFITK